MGRNNDCDKYDCHYVNHIGCSQCDIGLLHQFIRYSMIAAYSDPRFKNTDGSYTRKPVYYDLCDNQKCSSRKHN